MAIIKNDLITGYHTLTLSKPATKTLQWSLEARRATILFRRVKNIGTSPDVKIVGTYSPDTRDHSEITPYREYLTEQRSKPVWGEVSPNTSDHSEFSVNKRGDIKRLSDFVAIINIDAKKYNEGIDTITLPFVPKELNYNSELAYSTIKSMGRNNPFYHFTGAEDKLEFEIDWYSFDDGRKEVIEKCRKIEALSKANGYMNGPRRVQLLWGEDNLLFSNHLFIVLAAPYRLLNFNKGYIDKDNTVRKTSMMPIQGYQRVTLARITSDNLTTSDIELV